MAEGKKEEVKATNSIRVKGPKDSQSRSAIYRFTKDNGETIDLTPGMELNIGGTKEDDITKKEAERLLIDHRWGFEQVK